MPRCEVSLTIAPLGECKSVFKRFRCSLESHLLGLSVIDRLGAEIFDAIAETAPRDGSAAGDAAAAPRVVGDVRPSVPRIALSAWTSWLQIAAAISSAAVHRSWECQAAGAGRSELLLLMLSCLCSQVENCGRMTPAMKPRKQHSPDKICEVF